MTGRSLCCSPEGIERARKALDYHSLSQKALAEELGMSRQPVTNFFAGKRIDRKYFCQICERLNLEWDEIVAKPPSEPEVEANQDNSFNIDALVQEVREQVKPIIQERCGTMRVLDMSQPVGLNDIYTRVNILEKITGQLHKGIAELLQQCNFDDFERFGLSRIAEERVPGLDAVKKYTKLMILGKPGAGKTTFLKYLAIQCNRGEFQADCVPIFVNLKDFTEAANKPDLLEYMGQQFSGSRVVEMRLITSLKEVIAYGRALVLLDGLDEVREEDSSRVLKEIRDFSSQFRDNQFVITCRISALKYTFEKFTEVEIADFDDEQIYTFASNWFQGKAVKAESFIKRLEDNFRIKQLAANPLLLTLLCLVFEESGDFPTNHSELYKEGLDALLKKWDAKRGIYRDQVYEKLSPQRKEDLLSKIALITFKQGDYFFKQKAAEQYITNYIRNLPTANTDPEALQLDSEAVLRSIEAQHGLLVARAKGIYSFSHLTFHEYFTAREIVVGKHSSQEALQNLVSHITEKRWREVFLLGVGMLPSADCLLQLMKEKVDAMIAADEKLKQVLIWATEKSVSAKVPYKPTIVRAFYFEYALAGYLAYDINSFVLACSLGINFNSIRTFELEIDLTPAVDCDRAFASYDVIKLNSYIDDALGCDLDPGLKQALQQLKAQLPDSNGNKELLDRWWQANRLACAEQLRQVMIKYRNIGHNWHFSDQQKEVLKQYRDANKLLVECLNSDCYVSREVRYEIEETLLLPIAEIEDRNRR